MAAEDNLALKFSSSSTSRAFQVTQTVQLNVFSLNIHQEEGYDNSDSKRPEIGLLAP